MNEILIQICIKKMPGVRSIAMTYDLLYSISNKKFKVAPTPSLCNYFIIHPKKKKCNIQNDVLFDFSIGHYFVILNFL